MLDTLYFEVLFHLNTSYARLSPRLVPLLALVASSTMFRVLLSFIGPWLLWRLVTFSVLPWFQPNAPKELPYWIPGQSNVLKGTLNKFPNQSNKAYSVG